MLRERKAQSTLEYITVFTAIVAAIVVLAYAVLKPAVGKLMNAAADKIGDAADQFNPPAAPNP